MNQTFLPKKQQLQSLSDDDFICKTIETNRESLILMENKFKELKIKYIPTSANFYILLFPDSEFAKKFQSRMFE